MRNLFRFALVLGVLALLAGPALAQPGQQGQQITRLTVAANEGVQKELKFSEDTTKKVTELRDKYRTASRELFKGGKPNDETRKKLEELRTTSDKSLTEALDATQNKRLNEITLQAIERFSGLYSALRYGPGVAEALSINDEQKGKVQDAEDEYRKVVGELFKGGFKMGAQDEMRKKMDEARKASSDKIMGLLNDTQKAKLKELKGEDYKDVEALNPFGKPKTKPAAE